MAKEFDDFKKKYEAAIKELGKPANMKKLGDEAAAIIKKRTRLGYGASENDQERQALKPLSAKYIEYRKELGATKKAKFKASQLKAGQKVKLSSKDKKRASSESNIKLSDATSPTKSNLTLTGQMLDSLKATATQDGVSIDVHDKRNEVIAEANENRGRPFNYLAKGDLNQLRVLLSEIVDGIMKKLK